jgi:hypothetical protein
VSLFSAMKSSKNLAIYFAACPAKGLGLPHQRRGPARRSPKEEDGSCLPAFCGDLLILAPQSSIIQSFNPSIFNPQSSILNPQSSILQSSILQSFNLQSSILQSSILNPQSSILNLQSSIFNRQSFNILLLFLKEDFIEL